MSGVLNFTTNLLVQKNVTFQAVNVGAVVISGGGTGIDNDTIFKLASNATFVGLHLTNANNLAFHQRDTGARARIERCIISDTQVAFSINNSGATNGTYHVLNSTIVGVGTAFDMNDAGTINVTNSIIANAGVAYGAHNNIALNPNHNQLYNVTAVSSGTSSGHISVDPFQITADPMFVDAANGDYRLLTGSPAIDSGVDVGLPYIGAAPDRGAFEGGVLQTAAVPEPSSLLVFAGLFVPLFIRRRR
jgi:hypothetical protein